MVEKKGNNREKPINVEMKPGTNMSNEAQKIPDISKNEFSGYIPL